MQNTALGVAAAVLIGGGVLYGGYQLIGGDRDRTDLEERLSSGAEQVPLADAELADAEGAGSAAVGGDSSMSGVPNGTSAMDFDGGAEGERVTDAARNRADEAAREAERLAMLGTGEMDMAAGPDQEGSEMPSEADAEALAATDMAALDVQDAQDAGDRARGLRDTGSDAPLPDSDDAFERERTDSDVDRLLADIAARSGEDVRDEDDQETGVATADASPGGSALRGAASNGADARAGADGNRFARNARVADKPDQGGFAANRRLNDKPDAGGFTANRSLTDKPDDGGFVASADTQRFDPCTKADGTLYVGPGTALNPFAETDPCLPQATSQSYELANLQEAAQPALDTSSAANLTMPFVDVARPRLPPPPPVGIGSDYRG